MYVNFYNKKHVYVLIDMFFKIINNQDFASIYRDSDRLET